ncbi:MAG: hypothetical protein KGI50_07960 [Patescibacteria group bacterium]|nr:hypothetical protein [Patescibacteria group bacterium]
MDNRFLRGRDAGGSLIIRGNLGVEMKTKKELSAQKLKAYLASQGTPSALRAAGWTPSDLLAAGWTPSDLLAAGWTPSDLLAAGWTPSALRAAGWTPSDLLAAGWTPSALLAAGWTPSDLRDAQKEWDEIPVLEKPYTRLLSEIESGARKHNQSTFGPDCDPKKNLCGTPMCTAGHLVNMAGDIGYKLKDKYGWNIAATMIHRKSRPDVPPQNFGTIPQEFAMAYIRERAKEEAENNEI